MEKKSLVFAALDYDSQQENIAFAREIAENVNSDRYGFKVNLDSIANFSPHAMNPYSFIKEISSHGKPVFMDMKMWNGGRTMSNIAEGCADLGVSILNIYPHAMGKFIQRVKKQLEGSDTKLFSLTVLTHYKNRDTKELYGKNLGDAVKILAELGVDNGADGVVLPGTQLENMNYLNTLKLCPGIRPLWYENQKDNAQEQIVTPANAIRNGADYIVIGSPIRKSKNRSEALEKILSEILN